MTSESPAAAPATAAASPAPLKLDLSHPRYDQTQFLGRLRHFLDVTDVRTLLVSDKELRAATKLLKDYEAGLAPAATAEALWRAKKVRDAMVHPQTGETIPLPFRFSAFVPVNLLLCAGLLLPNPSRMTAVFWQWLNQSYNIAVNHANRNASNEMSTRQIAEAYVGSVALSCSLAVGLGELTRRLPTRWPAWTASLLRIAIPYTAVASAGAANVYLMRRNETVEGIEVRDALGDSHGKSQVAGKQAITKVVITRLITSSPVLFGAPLIMSRLQRTAWLARNPRLRFPTELAVITALLFVGVPPSIAVFPQEAAVPAADLEQRFRNRRDRDGRVIDTFYYNKGL